ncbi:uncharacterized protein LOC112637149 [Camponotus floridanus]|uniref:uncharacterized protein LOC112637149 n=1 Tax=Camponotus floridanus TaxID=104421 RepID=UPI000DC66553|nr:uncharacterized protein LOC112637149 [Camponotus floridanus]
MGRACCVSGCDSGVKVPSHKFPKNPKRCAEWINNLNLEHLKNYDSSSLQKFKVCHKHFRETDYSFAPHNHFLKDTAIPFIKHTTVMDTITNNSEQQQSQQFNLLLEVKNIEQIKIEPQETLVQYQIYNEQQYKETTENKQQENIQIPQIKEENLFQQVIHVNNQDVNNQEHVNNQENKEDPKLFKLIQDHEYRLNKLEEKVDFILNSSKRRIWNRPDLPKITCKAKLTPKVKSLYGTIIKLRRDKRRLQRLLQRFREENARKGQKTVSLKKNCQNI